MNQASISNADLREPEDRAHARGEANLIVWRIWPWLAWLLLVGLMLFKMLLNSGGWLMVALMFASPIVVPGLALLNLIPRMVMRWGAGLRSSTTAVSIAIVINWHAMVALMISVPDAGDADTIPSVLGEAFIGIGGAQEERLLLVGLGIFVISWVVALVFAIRATLKARKGVLSPGQHNSNRLIALTNLVVPAYLLVEIGIATSGYGPIEEEAVARRQAIWEEMQQELGVIRGGISDTDQWHITEGGAWGVGSDRGGETRFRVSSTWVLQTPEPVKELEERVLQVTDQEGWDPSEVEDPHVSRYLVEDEGMVLDSRVAHRGSKDEIGTLNISLDSRTPEGASEAVTHLEIRVSGDVEDSPAVGDIPWHDYVPDEEDPGTRTFGPDEWPALATVEAAL